MKKVSPFMRFLLGIIGILGIYFAINIYFFDTGGDISSIENENILQQIEDDLGQKLQPENFKEVQQQIEDIKKQESISLQEDTKKTKLSQEEKNEIEKITSSKKIDIDFSSYSFNSNINNLIEISGKDKDLISYVNIGGNSFTPIKENQQVFLTIPKNLFQTGDFFIILQLKNNEILTFDKKISFTFSHDIINIANITPESISNTKDTFIVLQGNGFSKIVSLQLSNNIILKNASFDIINDNVMSIKIPKNLEVGSYYFNIMTIGGITEIKNNNFYITY